MKTYIELSECLLFDLKEFNKEMNSEIDIYNERLYSIDQQIRSIQRMEIPEYVETIKKHHKIHEDLIYDWNKPHRASVHLIDVIAITKDINYELQRVAYENLDLNAAKICYGFLNYNSIVLSKHPPADVIKLSFVMKRLNKNGLQALKELECQKKIILKFLAGLRWGEKMNEYKIDEQLRISDYIKYVEKDAIPTLVDYHDALADKHYNLKWYQFSKKKAIYLKCRNIRMLVAYLESPLHRTGDKERLKQLVRILIND